MVTSSQIYKFLDEVKDPEIPVLSISDLGILRGVEFVNDEWLITITPTYSGCPAMQTIEQDILIHLKFNQVGNVRVQSVLSPAWTTDWITEEGKQKLLEYGIAPPVEEIDKSVLFAKPVTVPCPKCRSKQTKMVSQFGSTACKAHYQCLDCQEPYDYFKCLR